MNWRRGALGRFVFFGFELVEYIGIYCVSNNRNVQNNNLLVMRMETIYF